MTTLRELVIKISADSSSFHTEIARASRMGVQYHKMMRDGSRQSATAIRETQRALIDLNSQLISVKASANGLAGVFNNAFSVNELTRYTGTWHRFSGRLRQEISNVTGMLSGNKSEWRSWGGSILQTLEKVTLQIANVESAGRSRAANGLLGIMTGGVSGSHAASNRMPFAKGGIFGKPDLSRYSNSVVSQPTAFAFANGGGVMGEAGPEAIVPLTRLADGTLGVRAIAAGAAAGAIGIAPQVYISIYTSGNATASASQGSGSIQRCKATGTATSKTGDDKTPGGPNEKNQDKATTDTDWAGSLSKGYEDWYKSVSDIGGTVSKGLTSTLNGAFTNVTSMLEGNKVNWRSWGVSILQILGKVALQMAVVEMAGDMKSVTGFFGSIVNSAIGFLGGGSGSAPPAANVAPHAKGGVYDSPGLSAYSGKIVNTPTFFAFAHGGGVMGEAGPEAIMPLTRTADGSLGVRTVGAGSSGTGGSPQVYINIDNSGNTTTQSSQGMEQFGGNIGQYVQQQYRLLLRRDLNPGGSIWRAVKGA